MPMQNKHVREWVTKRVEHAILLDGYDDAIAGVAVRGGSEPVLVYDRARLIAICMTDGMPRNEANAWVSMRVEFESAGELSPWIMNPIPKTDLKSKGAEVEVERLRAALIAIAAMKDEPYCSDFAKDILANREVP